MRVHAWYNIKVSKFLWLCHGNHKMVEIIFSQFRFLSSSAQLSAFQFEIQQLDFIKMFYVCAFQNIFKFVLHKSNYTHNSFFFSSSHWLNGQFKLSYAIYPAKPRIEMKDAIWLLFVFVNRIKYSKTRWSHSTHQKESWGRFCFSFHNPSAPCLSDDRDFIEWFFDTL